MTSAFHRKPPPSPGFEPVRRLRVNWRLHPVLTGVLNALDGTVLGRSFKDRAVTVSTSKIMGDPVDYDAALGTLRWFLERVDGEGVPLTEAGYLKPAIVREIAAELPTMRDWPFPVNREVDSYPVFDFREHLKGIGLLRKYKGTLRLSRAARAVRGDANDLWDYLADTLVPAEPQSVSEASVVVLVHAATTDGDIDVKAVVDTLIALGYTNRDGSPVALGFVSDVWNGLWAMLGTIGRAPSDDDLTRKLSHAARILVHDALFDETFEERPV